MRTALSMNRRRTFKKSGKRGLPSFIFAAVIAVRDLGQGMGGWNWLSLPPSHLLGQHGCFASYASWHASRVYAASVWYLLFFLVFVDDAMRLETGTDRRHVLRFRLLWRMCVVRPFTRQSVKSKMRIPNELMAALVMFWRADTTMCKGKGKGARVDG
ncbi:hypothetical protein LZ30DRAFT_54443 [Colletotrichum cereale]|nr:hypothetical protein LZ30DRAFT_54443 [Colletotrichum cereale]